jgi:hypothetical protein
MKTLAVIVEEMIGLFVEDGSLAIGTVIVFVVAAIAALALNAPSLVVGLLLLAGCVAVLSENVLRYGRKNR